jgi:hypothetical protein
MYSIRVNQLVTGQIGFGLQDMDLNSYVGGFDAKSIGFSSDGDYLHAGTVQDSGLPTWGSVNDVVDIALDLNTGIWWIRVNGGNWNGTRNEDPSSGTGSVNSAGLNNLYPAITPFPVNIQGQVTLLPQPIYSVPAGFTFLGDITASVGFYGTSGFSDSEFINLSQSVSSAYGIPQTFSSATDASTWLTTNGFWNSYVSVTPTPTGTLPVTSTPTTTSTPTPSETPTNTPTPTTTDLTSVTTFTISGCTNLNVLVADLGPSSLAPGDVFNFTFTGGTPSGCYRIVEKTVATPTDGATPLLFYVNCAACEATLVTPTPTTTSTPTPSVTNTGTPSVTPTLTPTPSTSPIPVTGYSFNLIVLPYNFPATGNTIMNQGAVQTGTTNPNELTINGRGIYFNSIDSDGIDRTSYFSQFTGQSITITMTQTGSTAIYSGDTSAFKYWSGNTGEPPGVAGDGFVFGTQVGVPPLGTPSGNAVLIQSATTNWTVGLPVYISAEINVGVTPTPTETSTNTPTPSVTNTQTPSVTPTLTPTNTETTTPTPTLTPTPTRTSSTPTPTPTLTQTPSPTPYTTLAGSLLFNGSNQSLGISPGVTFGAGTFTLEGWFYNNGLFNNVGIVGSPVTSPTGCLNLYFANGTTITSDRNGGGGSFSYTMGSTITANQWHYLIYNRNADGTTAVYIDGVRCTATSLDTLNYITATDTIGRYYGGYWPGYWTNMRMTIGTAVYNSNLTTQSTPRGPLTSLANTKYLMLGAVVTTDSSGTQTVTNNNGVTQTSVKPFTPPANPPF